MSHLFSDVSPVVWSLTCCLMCHLFLSPQVNVMGAHCDLCKPGFYNLQENHLLGCTDCFCFGVSDVCESSAWSSAQVTNTDKPVLSQGSSNINFCQYEGQMIIFSGASYRCLAPPLSIPQYNPCYPWKWTPNPWQHFLWPSPPTNAVVGSAWKFPWQQGQLPFPYMLITQSLIKQKPVFLTDHTSVSLSLYLSSCLSLSSWFPLEVSWTTQWFMIFHWTMKTILFSPILTSLLRWEFYLFIYFNKLGI